MEKVKSFGKINLMLKVINKKDNGYHELQMINKRINLYDDISVSYSDVDKVVISDPNIDTKFIYNILKKTKDIYNIKNHYDIVIKKNIPVGSGLGGASMNAGTIIDTILKMEEINDTLENKINNFKDMGADIPYSFISEDAIVEGIGEKIYIIKEKISFPLVLVNPNNFISTKEVFENNKKYSNKYTHEYILNNIYNKDIYINDLEISTFELNKELYNLKHKLSKYGKVVMSGTGSSLIVHTNEYDKIKEEYPNYLVIKVQ